MRRVFGPRTVVEAVFLVAVPVIVLAAGKGPSAIIASAGIAYLLVILVEVGLWRAGGPEAAAAESQAPPEQPETVHVLPAAAAEGAVRPEPHPDAAPQPVAVAAAPEPPPEPAGPGEEEPVRVLRPVPAAEPAAAPEPEPEPEPEPGPRTVVPIAAGAVHSALPRQWNLWDLERLTREHAGQDEARDEERSFLLMYLRDFAGADGLLPIDFDGLVRDSFGDLVGA